MLHYFHRVNKGIQRSNIIAVTGKGCSQCIPQCQCNMQCLQNKNKLSFKTNPIVIRFRKHDWNQGRCPAHVPPVPRPSVGLLHVAGHLVRDTPLHQDPRDQEGSQRLVWGPRQVSGPDLILLHILAASQAERLLQQKLK